MTEIGLVTIDPGQYGSGWTDADGYVGVYLHRGRAYLSGAMWNSHWNGDTGTTLLTVPSRFAPAAAVVVSVPVDYSATTDPATPGIDVPVAPYGATVNPDGTLVLDTLPPYVNTAPDAAVYNHWDMNSAIATTPKLADFPGPLTTQLLLSNLSWIPAHETALADDDAPYVSAAPYIGADFEDVDSQVAVHDARVHVTGRVRARRSNATMAFVLPSQYTQGIPADSSARFPARGPHDTFTAQVFRGGTLELYPDVTADPTPDAPPVWPDPFWWSRPSFVGLDDWRRYMSGTNDFRLQRYHVMPGTVPELQPTVVWNHGNNFGPCGRDIFNSDIMCPSVGACGTFSDTISRFLEPFFPTPDWFIVTIEVTNGPGPGAPGFPVIGKGVTTCDPSGVGCGPFVNTGTMVLAGDTTFNLVDTTGAHLPLTLNPISGPTEGREYYDGTFNGLLQRTLGGYTGNQSNAASSLLWAPGEIDELSVTLNGVSNSGSLYIIISIVPFWEQRKRVLLAGDIIDLTDSGWQGLYTAPPPPPPFPPAPPDLIPSTVGFGPAQHGLLTRRPVLGRTGQLATGSSGIYSMGGLVRLAAMLGFGSNAPMAAAVAMAESRGDPFAEGVNVDGSRDRGLWQINSVAWPDITDQCAFTPYCNGQQAYRISYGGTDWRAWSTYNNGAFETYLPAAQAAYAVLQRGSSSQFASSQHGLLFH